MEELKNSATNGTGEAIEGENNTEGHATERTFTQADVNRIVQDRLAKEKGKDNEELTRRAAELDARERRLNVIDELGRNGLPSYLVDALNTKTDEEFKNSIEIIKRLKGEATEGIENEASVMYQDDPIGVVKRGHRSSSLRNAFGL